MQTEPITITTVQQTPPVTPERFARIPLDLVRESAANPRKHFDERAMAELADSIRTSGVAVPILVRDLPAEVSDQYELIDGARRFRAAKDAGLHDIPARIIDCDDQTALELSTIANLQRQDVHPLDEALGFRQLIERSGYDVPAIAARIGKSESYVYQRLKLTDLIDEARKLLWTEKISVAVALLMARVPADVQEQMIDEDATESVRNAEYWLEQNVYLALDKAPWSKTDASLLPIAGSCYECSKRTGYVPALFPEVENGDTCLDPQCFGNKKKAFVELKRAEKPADVIEVSTEWKYGQKGGDILDASKYQRLDRSEAKETEGARQALIVEGADAGKTIWIKPSPSGGGYQKTAEEKQAEKARKEEERIAAEVLDRCLDAQLGQVRLPLHDGVLRVLTIRMLDRLSKDGQKKLAKSWNVKVRKINGQCGGTFYDVETPLLEHIKEMGSDALFVTMVDIASRRSFNGEPDLTVFEDFLRFDAARIEREVRDDLAAPGGKTKAVSDPTPVEPHVEPKPTKKVPPPKKKAPAKKAAKKKPAAKKKSK